METKKTDNNESSEIKEAEAAEFTESTEIAEVTNVTDVSENAENAEENGDGKKDKKIQRAKNVRKYEERRFIGKRTHIVTKQGSTGEKSRAFMKSLEEDGSIEQMKSIMKADAQYIAGICSNFTSKGYDYWVAVEVEEDTEIPEDFETISAPEGRYAYFESEGGSIEAVTKRWSEIYNAWFPKSGYNHQGTQELEIYPLGDMEAEDYRCTLLVPVRLVERIPLNSYRRSALGGAPFVLLGSVAGLLLSGAKDTKSMLIGGLIGGLAAMFLYGYYAKRREDRERAKYAELNKEDDDE